MIEYWAYVHHGSASFVQIQQVPQIEYYVYSVAVLPIKNTLDLASKNHFSQALTPDYMKEQCY